MSASCPLCDGACNGAELRPLIDPQLQWFWTQIGRAADRRGDPVLIEGSISVRAPGAAEERAAAAGLVGGRVLKPGQARTVDLHQLTLKLRVRGAQLTPGAVAAHALGRRLAARAAADAQRQEHEDKLLAAFRSAANSVPHEAFREPEQIWSSLRRSGAIGRLLAADDPEPLLRSALTVVAALPARETRTDRRRLAADATGNPHALDHGSSLAGLVIPMLVAAGRIKSRQRPREAWASVGVDYDDVVGGLIAIGILPAGWSAPPEATVTLPPRVLRACKWPRPETHDSYVFVTENPSVTAAAADLAATVSGIRILCTSGTPSASEISAIGRIAFAGWRIAVRADFDAAGVGHVGAILGAVPDAVPWRMNAGDYIDSLRTAMQDRVLLELVPDAPWDPTLPEAMRETGLAAYEESLMPLLLDDLRRGAPPPPLQEVPEDA